MYKIFYGFKTAENKISYNSSLGCVGDTPEEGLLNWSKYTTQFVLQNLVYIEILELQYGQYGRVNGKFLTVKNKPTIDMITKFINERKL